MRVTGCGLWAVGCGLWAAAAAPRQLRGEVTVGAVAHLSHGQRGLPPRLLISVFTGTAMGGETYREKSAFTGTLNTCVKHYVVVDIAVSGNSPIQSLRF